MIFMSKRGRVPDEDSAVIKRYRYVPGAVDLAFIEQQKKEFQKEFHNRKNKVDDDKSYENFERNVLDKIYNAEPLPPETPKYADPPLRDPPLRDLWRALERDDPIEDKHGKYPFNVMKEEIMENIKNGTLRAVTLSAEQKEAYKHYLTLPKKRVCTESGCSISGGRRKRRTHKRCTSKRRSKSSRRA